jgi:hypothetical protein
VLGYGAPVTDGRSASPETDPSAAPASTTPAPAAVDSLRGPRWLLPAVVAGLVVVLAAAGLTYWLNRPAKSGFDSPEGIAALLAERGAPCADYESDDEGLAKERGACFVNGERVIIAVFESRPDVEAHWERQLQVAPDNQTVGMVIGPTWSISGTATTYLQHAAELLDAEYRSN